MKWIRPSGVPIETNDLPETIAYAKEHGWKEDKPKPKAKPKKK